MHFKHLAALGSVLLAIGGLTACGDDDDGSGGASTPAKPAANAPTGDPIIVGSICSCSGAQAAVLASVKDVNEAWAKSVNANGGINGHPVKMVVIDDGGVPAKGLAAAKKLIEQEKVVAIVGQLSLTDGAWEKYVASKGVPVVGGLPIAAPFLKNPDWFASGASQVVVTAAIADEAKQAGKKSLGVMYCAESPVCAQLDPLAKGAAKLFGLGYHSAKVSSTAPNYTAPCLANKGAGTDAVYIAMNSAVVQRVIDACAKQGYKPLSVSSTNVVGKAWLSNPNLDGAIAVSTNATPWTGGAAVKEFLAALDEYAPGVTENDGFGVNQVYPWAGGKLFEAAARAAKLTPTSTPADVKKGLYTLKDETLGGLTGPLTFTKGKPAFPTCYFTIKLGGGKFAGSDTPACLSAQQATALTAALKG